MLVRIANSEDPNQTTAFWQTTTCSVGKRIFTAMKKPGLAIEFVLATQSMGVVEDSS